MSIPKQPVVGAGVWVQTGPSSLGTNYRVTRVNARSFYVTSDGTTTRFLLPEWTQWLHRLAGQGRVFVDGDEFSPAATSAASQPRSVTLAATVRDARFLRAARDVLKRYRFDRTESGVVVRVTVAGGSKGYALEVWRDWRVPPRCSCPDAARASTGGFCKHVVAYLLREQDLRFQLLDALI